MRRLLLAFALCAALVLPASAEQTVYEGPLAPKGYLQDTTISTASTLGTIPGGAHIALIQVTGQSARWRDDGVAPTATVGMLLAPGETLVYNGALSAFQIIETAASATLNVSFYGPRS